jgi:hypothetical protein
MQYFFVSSMNSCLTTLVLNRYGRIYHIIIVYHLQTEVIIWNFKIWYGTDCDFHGLSFVNLKVKLIWDLNFH